MPLPLPTLAEIAADPAKISRLSGAAAAAVGAAFSGLATSCALRAAIDATANPAPTEHLGTLSLDEAAQLLGLSASTLRHRAKHPPYAELRVDNGTRRIRFSAAKIRAYLERPASAVGRGQHGGPRIGSRRGLRGLE